MIAVVCGAFLSGCACTPVLVAGYQWFYAPLSHVPTNSLSQRKT